MKIKKDTFKVIDNQPIDYDRGVFTSNDIKVFNEIKREKYKVLLPSMSIFEAIRRNADKLDQLFTKEFYPIGNFCVLFQNGVQIFISNKIVNVDMKLTVYEFGISRLYSVYRDETLKSDSRFIEFCGEDLSPQQLAYAIYCVVFYSYAETETKILNTKSKHGHLHNCKYFSDVNNEIIVLDSTWFTTLIKTEGFKVRGHFRLQPYGEGLIKKKLIWISDYDKEGYTREAKILHKTD